MKGIIALTIMFLTIMNTQSMYLMGNESTEKIYIKSDSSYVIVLETMLKNHTSVELYNDDHEMMTTFTPSLCESANSTNTVSIEDSSSPCNCYCSGHPVEACTCAKQCDGSGCCYNSYMKFYYICEVHACCNYGVDYGCPNANSPNCEDGCGA